MVGMTSCGVAGVGDMAVGFEDERAAQATAPTTTTPAPTTTTALGPPYIGPLTFAWPTVACRVAVRETASDSDDGDSAFSYTLDVQPDERGLVVSVSNMTVHELNDDSTPRVAERERIESAAYPSFLINATDGRIIDILNRAELVDGLEPGFDPADANTVVDERANSYYWESWVGFWVELGAVSEGIHEVMFEYTINDVVIDAPNNIESLGTTTDGNVILVAEETIDGEDLVNLVTLSAERAGFDEESIDDGHRVIRVEATIDPQSLRPDQVTRSTELRMKVDHLNMVTTLEEVWTFDWESSDCN